MVDELTIYVARANIVGGNTTIFKDRENLEFGPNELLPPLPRGLWSRVVEFAPIRRILLQTEVERMLLRYGRAYLRSYAEFVARHVPPEHKSRFAFPQGVEYGMRLVYSRFHGAAVIFDPGERYRFNSRIIDERIEHFIWPRTKPPWPGVKTSFRSDENHLTIFVPGKGMHAGGALTLIYNGVLIYEGRMVLKGSRSPEEWSPAAACFDALHTFMRVAGEITKDEVVLKRILDQGSLEIRARAAALVGASDP